MSSVTVQLSLRSIRSGDRREPVLCGSAPRSRSGSLFLGLQLYDYSQLGFGLKDGAFGTLFYVMTGIHMAHVIGGVVFLAARLRSGVAAGACRRRITIPSPPARSTGTSSTSSGSCLFTTFYLLTPR